MAVAWQGVRVSNLVLWFSADVPFWRPAALVRMTLIFLVAIPFYNYRGLDLFADADPASSLFLLSEESSES